MGKEPTIKLSWDFEPVKYKHFTDLGNYLIQFEDVDAADIEVANRMFNSVSDPFTGPTCTAVVKRNKEGEVIIGRNMDIEISQNPAYMTRIRGGKYEAVSFLYTGVGNRYRYDQCEEADADEAFCGITPFGCTDIMNETGLYLEANIREVDMDFRMECTGTNPGKERASFAVAMAMAATKCATVPEVVALLNDSYDFYAPPINIEGVTAAMNLGVLAGDAQGNYGLVEFGLNKVFFTPYANGHANYYIHPSLAEYAMFGSGYGRLAAALEGLPSCEDEYDMMHNMEACMWKKELTETGCLGYSDFLTDLSERRAKTQEELYDGFDAQLDPVRPLAEAFYAGDEKPLRDSGAVWTTSFNYGVNCAKKHLMLRLWENDDLMVDVQW